MIELNQDRLVFSFPEVHTGAKVQIEFQRTLRIPDDDQSYPLPPGFGRFPLRHVDDFGRTAPAHWIEHGGVMLPMYQSEAMWLYFDSEHIDGNDASYPFAVKIAAGKIDAVTGEAWSDGIHRPQDYVVIPEQPWLDGYCVEKGYIRQFVAMPLGAGYTAEEQITGKAEHGGLQVVVYPMKREVFERRFPQRPSFRRTGIDHHMAKSCAAPPSPEIGLAPGGRMRQDIYDDPFQFSDWDREHSSRCFVHIANSVAWRAIAGEHPPTKPPTAKEYTRAGLPWFDYYNDSAEALESTKVLKGLKSVATLGKDKGEHPLSENEAVSPEHIVTLRRGLKRDQVREGVF